ncbi:Rap1a/Tai family immunity protein [Kiloniella laminariae]|uniref:Rap1a/Tai family immunity protein n=1 Tax=Kiloniella laminariae TaxID=454162 RepID=UPI0022B1EBEE|nr:Rap1a/Tai family immunity protein [Kiloniella laminariae]
MKYLFVLGAALFLAGCPHQPSQKSYQTAYELSEDEAYDGHSFYERCAYTTMDSRENWREHDICTWYISYVSLRPDVKKATCYPGFPSARETHDTVVNFIRKNPQSHSLTAREVIIQALKGIYPCNR